MVHILSCFFKVDFKMNLMSQCWVGANDLNVLYARGTFGIPDLRTGTCAVEKKLERPLNNKELGDTTYI